MTQVVDVAAELIELRARVAALEAWAKFSGAILEGGGVSRNAGGYTPALQSRDGTPAVWGCSSERPRSEDSCRGADLRHVVGEWIKFPGDVQGAEH